MKKPVKLLTNSFIITKENTKILLGMKKRGFGKGKFNGFGGKIEATETPLEAAQREIMEEAGISMKNPKLIGEIFYTYEDMDCDLHVFVFRATEWEPEDFTESEEMKPQWFDVKDIPFDSMWADDIYWYKNLIEGTEFELRCDFAKDHKTVLDFQLIEK